MGKPNKTQNSEAILSVCFSSPVLLVLFIAFLKCSTKTISSLQLWGPFWQTLRREFRLLGPSALGSCFCITYFEHKTNKVVQSRMNTFVCFLTVKWLLWKHDGWCPDGSSTWYDMVFFLFIFIWWLWSKQNKITLICSPEGSYFPLQTWHVVTCW